MPTAVTMPQLGESVVEGTVTHWYKQPGETVEKLEPLLEIATDKIDTEVPSPVSGVLLGVLVDEGATVDAGVTLAYIGESGESMPSGDANLVVEKLPHAPNPEFDNQSKTRPAGRNFISPVVSRIAVEHAVDLAGVPGTGMKGRITKKDLLRYIEEQGANDQDRPVDPGRANIQTTSVELGAAEADEVLQPLTTMRRAIAEHMTKSVRSSPHVTTVHEVDMTAVVQHREANKGSLTDKGINLTYTPYFVTATIAGLKMVPEMNGRFTEQGVVINRRIHIGVAVAIADGLVVPVIRDADERNLAGLARSINNVTAQARASELTADQLQGGTFTLTNHGTGGSLLATPIINQPQVAILGHRDHCQAASRAQSSGIIATQRR